MEFLARAGFDTNEIMSAMPGMLDLAASANMDLGRAADITSNIISGFGYEASEAGRIADVLAKASSTANTDVNGLGAAMATVAPVAATLGLDFEDLAAAVGTMADAGIDGSTAGRQLRQGMLRLANPTGQAADLIEELGINVFDADGNMKSMDAVVGELAGGLDGMEANARTAALSILFGAESTAGWSALLERGSDDLGNYAEELRNSEGAAADMAEVMEANAKGSLREFRSSLEGAGIAISEHIIPSFTKVVEWGTEWVRKFGELDDSTQKTILVVAGLAAALGPVLVVGGQIIGGLGTLALGLSGVTGMIAGSAGLTAAVGGLLGPIGIGVGLVAGIAGGIYLWNKRSERATEVNLEVANSLIEQADSLEDITGRYEELRRRSGLTTTQIGELLDIQTRMETETDPEKLKKLEDAYKEIAKQSGLSGDEIDELLEANNRIIDQTPEVEQTFTERGNAVVEVTDAIYDQIQAMRDLALEELEENRIIALEKEAELRREHIELTKELESVEEKRNTLIELNKLGHDEIEKKLEENLKKQDDINLTYEERERLQEEEAYLNTIITDQVGDVLQGLQDQRKEIQEKLKLNDAELSQIEAIDDAIAGIYLKELDINEAGKEGIKLAEDKLQEYRDQKAELEEIIKKEGDAGGQIQEQISLLDQKIGQHESVLNKIDEETRLTSEVLRNEERIEQQIRQNRQALDEIENGLYGVQASQEGVNERISEGTRRAMEMHAEASKDATKNVTVTDNGTIADIERRARQPVTKRVTINATPGNRASVPIAAYAEGTNYHPGGLALVGEEGPELARHGNSWSMLGFGITDLPRGTEVYTHEESKKIIQALNGFPAYAGGISSIGEAERIVSSIEQNQNGSGNLEGLLIELIQAVREGKNIIMKERVIGELLEPHVTEAQHRKNYRKGRMAPSYG